MTPTTTSRPRALLRAAVAALGVWLAVLAALNLFIVGRAATDENLFIDPLSRLYVVEHVDGQPGTPRARSGRRRRSCRGRPTPATPSRPATC